MYLISTYNGHSMSQSSEFEFVLVFLVLSVVICKWLDCLYQPMIDSQSHTNTHTSLDGMWRWTCWVLALCLRLEYSRQQWMMTWHDAAGRGGEKGEAAGYRGRGRGGDDPAWCFALVSFRAANVQAMFNVSCLYAETWTTILSWLGESRGSAPLTPGIDFFHFRSSCHWI